MWISIDKNSSISLKIETLNKQFSGEYEIKGQAAGLNVVIKFKKKGFQKI